MNDETETTETEAPEAEVIYPLTEAEWIAAQPEEPVAEAVVEPVAEDNAPETPPDDLAPDAELPEEWWQNKELLEREYEKYGTLSAVANAHGVTATTLSMWWRKHDLPKLKRGPRGTETTSIDGGLISGVHATDRKRAHVYFADGDWEILKTIEDRLHVKTGEAIRTAVRVYGAILGQSK